MIIIGLQHCFVDKILSRNECQIFVSTQALLRPCQTPIMKLLTEIGNSFKSLTIFVKTLS